MTAPTKTRLQDGRWRETVSLSSYIGGERNLFVGGSDAWSYQFHSRGSIRNRTGGVTVAKGSPLRNQMAALVTSADIVGLLFHGLQ